MTTKIEHAKVANEIAALRVEVKEWRVEQDRRQASSPNYSMIVSTIAMLEAQIADKTIILDRIRAEDAKHDSWLTVVHISAN
jgi:hypothetical protein